MCTGGQILRKHDLHARALVRGALTGIWAAIAGMRKAPIGPDRPGRSLALDHLGKGSMHTLLPRPGCDDEARRDGLRRLKYNVDTNHFRLTAESKS